MNIKFIELDIVLAIHSSRIDLYGGAAGIRDIGLLHSAIAMPSAGFGGEFLHSDVFEMAAAYLFHIVQNHPFIDGNKRTGLATALVFLEINGISISAEGQLLEDMTVDVAKAKIGKKEIARLLRDNSR